LEERLKAMGKAGQLFAIDFGGTWVFKMMPWVFGIYEFQNERLDKDFAVLYDGYREIYWPFRSNRPSVPEQSGHRFR